MTGTISPGSLLADMLRDEALRDQYLTRFIRSSIATQIRALRCQRGWTQVELGRRAGLKQPVIALLENSARHWEGSVTTLCKIAHAFDVALSIRFASWGEIIIMATGVYRVPPPMAEDPELAAIAAVHPEGVRL